MNAKPPEIHSVEDNRPIGTPRKVTLLMFWVLLLACSVNLVVFLHYYYHTKPLKDPSAVLAHPLAPVVLAKAHSGEMKVFLSALGSVTPTETVTVKTQVNGQLLKVLFREGQKVTVGEQLAEIDPNIYQAQLIQYEGQLARDLALLENAQLDLERYQTLFQQDSISKQILDTQESLVKQYQGTVKLDGGLVETARLNLSYCQIKSPISGTIGLRLVDPGNIVQTTDANGLAIINTIQPITVVFSIPEDNIPQVTKQIAMGKPLIVEAYDRAQEKLLESGTVLTIDNEIDPSTGTVKLKAEFKNIENKLFPNQFVNIRLLVDTLHNATIIPMAAIQHGSRGDFVYLLTHNSTVHLKPVTVGVNSGDEVTVTSDLSPGEFVVIEGTDKLTDGAVVTVSDTAIHPR